ncbi:hypothetical protein CN367_12380 [Priestia megaterium]|nr:hypothetical protein AMS61_25370 [Bacillus sp. FJAT-21351]PEZ46739.1 hypothetical protein CN367_12380 [Priestia megaterium]PFL58947.1 hypothetical protein COJ36_29705 [Priestia megaterium]
MLFSLLKWGLTIYRKGTNMMDMFLRNIDLIAVKKIDEIAKEKNISSQEFLKVGLKRREVQREIKDYDKGRKEIS